MGQPSSDFVGLRHTYSVSGEGTQYAYYKAGNSKVKNRSGSAETWWERSPYSDSVYTAVFSVMSTATAAPPITTPTTVMASLSASASNLSTPPHSL